MTWRPFPIVGESYADTTKPYSAQDTVNWMPVLAERVGTTSTAMLRGVPGLNLAGVLGGAFDGRQKTGIPIRGSYNADGVFVIVQANTLYRWNSVGPTAIGTIPGTGRVSITRNQITGGSQIVIANGQAGYVYNTVTNALTQITDEGFPGAKSVDYIDSYIVGVEPSGRFWFASALADATSYNTLDRYEAESAPDKIVGLIVSHSEVIVFGERTMEFYYDSGANTGTFQRRDGTQTEVGAASQFAIVKLDNTVFWAGNDGCLYKLNGYTPERISTQPIEQAIAKCDLSKCFAMVYADGGHKIVYFTFPDGMTFGYDVATSAWHRRQSYRMKRWRVNTLTQWNGAWYAGDYTNGALYAVEWGVNTENGQPLVAERVSTVMHDDQNRFRLKGVELVMDSQKSRPSTTLSELPLTPTMPPLLNATTTVVDLSTALFADSSDPAGSADATTPAGVATATDLSLYQSGAPTTSNGTYALIPLKIDISGCDTFDFSFKYNKGTYAAPLSYEALQLGFYLNAGDFANYTPWTQYGALAVDQLGIGGVLDSGVNFQQPTSGALQLLIHLPPRTEYPDGDDLLGNLTSSDSGAALPSGAYDGTSTWTVRFQMRKGPSTAGEGYDGQTVTLQALWVAIDGQVLFAPDHVNNLNPFEISAPDASGTSPDILASPHLPLTLTPYIRRVTFDDTANNPMTLSDLSITVGQGLVMSSVAAEPQDDPCIELRTSKDGGQNWSFWRQARAGLQGAFNTKLRFRRLGFGERITLHVRVSADRGRDLIGASVDTEAF